uniref:Transmembrane protein n=1 Tax=Panagrellus redivivus TaxID=6233 RepID=A0A7E4VVM5_PANRE
MVKPTRLGPAMPPASRDQYRINIGNGDDMNGLWNPDDDKFKVLCRLLHVTKAALHIGYTQMMISIVFAIFFGYHYMMAISGSHSTDHWINQYTAKYISQLLFAVAVQLILVIVMIHGVRSERRSLLLPYIAFTALAIIAGCAQLGTDIIQVERVNALNRATGGSYNVSASTSTSQLTSHLIATMIHIWCLSVVWRCYGFLGEQKVAKKISEQLSVTHAAFHYPDIFGSYGMPQPPPYADTVTTEPPQGRPIIIKSVDEDKQPLTTA